LKDTLYLLAKDYLIFYVELSGEDFTGDCSARCSYQGKNQNDQGYTIAVF